MTEEVVIPSIIVEELKKKGLNPEDAILNALMKVINLDPSTMMEARMELAIKYLNEGRELIDRDPVQASEKLYKAAEESVKALAQYYDLKNILSRVSERGRWTVTELEKVVETVSEKLGDWLVRSWDAANYLHVWGFHETKLDPEAVRIRYPYIERIVNEINRVIKTRLEQT
ncbi:PaREP1 family protein [Vulcanisaeta souniana]|uniref:PaREP1 family protein n=1 Tax=Vulcanisaeta souniana JCM 11219 TaxID=1293586 RepID=A0A830EH81_9CREN|nr:PaREP1 family protein [Vulcanisaeta souniana]BDR91686.1 hypothetical protein Vsou_07790 [Vulcanisaeta souniana JCM 11219]GGI71219.1 hypothetical protein GCM10007112_05170 [Vulcanisaeta souniana JCM 11219]